jgi:predicted small secreted protein
MKLMKKAVLGLFLAAVTVITFAGCHTAHGFGEDMEDAGHSIQDKTQ